jgi:hypothetical protein
MTDIFHPHARSACGWTTFLGRGEVVRRDVRSPAFVLDVRAFLFEQCSVGIDVDELLVSS